MIPILYLSLRYFEELHLLVAESRTPWRDLEEETASRLLGVTSVSLIAQVTTGIWCLTKAGNAAVVRGDSARPYAPAVLAERAPARSSSPRPAGRRWRRR